MDDCGNPVSPKCENDPFDLGVPKDLPNLTADVNWKHISDWAPDLEEVKRDDGGTAYAGRKSDIAQATLYHRGKPLRLDNHAFLLPIYNDEHPRVVLKCSRQVAKSTTLCNLQIIESLIRPYWRSLYVSPSALQTRQYSNEKLRPTLFDSPFVSKVFLGKGVTDQVFEKTLLNGAYLFLRYAFLTAARARGIPASRVLFDEAQDLLSENIKVISQSLSASRLAEGVEGMEMLAGTPLTFNNALETYWEWSTQKEWMTPCDCKLPRYWNFLDEKNIGKKGLVCKRCDKPLRAASGQWVTTSPGELYDGYHISQLMVPWKQSEAAWATEIVLPYEKWPASKFFNEILGFSYDSAGKPVSRTDIQQCCWPNNQYADVDSSKFHTGIYDRARQLRVFAGIDYGEGREEGERVAGKKKYASWTVLTLGAYVSGDMFWPFFMKKYVGREIDPEFILPEVIHLCSRWRVECVGADWGHGWGMNKRLFNALGAGRVMQFAYSHNLGERKRWDPDAYKWIVNRNAVLSDVFEEIKKQRFLFPVWQEFQPFATDIEAEYVEYNDTAGTMKYDHAMDTPDDALHSLAYCKLAADITLKRF